MQKGFGIILLSLLFSVSGFSQRNKAKDSLVFKERYTKAVEIKLDSFMGIWLLNGKDPRMPQLRQFHKDPIYTYFWKSKDSYKIKNGELLKTDYLSVNGSDIIDRFYKEIIPEEDKKKAKSISCTFFGYNGFKKLIYAYVETKDVVNIDVRYLVRCEENIKFDKNYTAVYNMKTKELVNTTPANNNNRPSSNK